MSAFRKFDPRCFRESAGGLGDAAKFAKPAKPPPVDPSFSSFSDFSRGSSPNCDSWGAADWQAYFGERAAIRETG